jgi:hypothetical protein
MVHLPGRCESLTFNQAAGDFKIISSDETILTALFRGFRNHVRGGNAIRESREQIHVQADEEHLTMISKIDTPQPRQSSHL